MDYFLLAYNIEYGIKSAEGFVTELAPFYVQSTWGSRKKRVRTAELACCNYYYYF